MSLFKVKRYLSVGDEQKAQLKENPLEALRAKAIKRKLEKADLEHSAPVPAEKSKKPSDDSLDIKSISPSCEEHSCSEDSDESSEEDDDDVATQVEQIEKPTEDEQAEESTEVDQTEKSTELEQAEKPAEFEQSGKVGLINQGNDNYNPLEALKARIKEDGGFQVLGDDFENTASNKVRRILPKWLSKPTVIEDAATPSLSTSFCIGLLHETIKENLLKMGIKQLFPVQEKVIPVILRGTKYGNGESSGIQWPSDLCVSAATGSGKTLAFAIPIVQSLHQHGSHSTQALVVLPTREIATQVYEIFTLLCKQTSLTCSLLIGAKGMANERKHLVRKNRYGVTYSANIVICTPGKLVDHLKLTEDWCLRYLRFLVIDEADRMMDHIKLDWLKKLEQHLVSKGRKLRKNTSLTINSLSEPLIPLQKLLFSATLSADPEQLESLNLFLPRLFTAICKPPTPETAATTPQIEQDKTEAPENEDKKLAFVGKYTTPIGLKEYMLICDAEDKLLHAVHLLLKCGRSLCFTKSVETANQLSTFMELYLEHSEQNSGFVCRQFSSAMSPKKRDRTMKDFKNNKINSLICSDAAARGLDVLNVDHVILYDVPSQIKTYVHRIGRTARAGKQGAAYSILTKEKVYHFKLMLSDAGKKRPKKIKALSDEDRKVYLPVYEKVLPLLWKRLEKNKKN